VAAVTVAAVIPAYNEEQTIGRVLDVVCRLPLIDEVIVVSDGSTDRTAAVARAHGARVIELATNMGKGAAMQVGVQATAADVLLFLDADLIGLTAQHVLSLLEPVVSGRSDMAVGVFDGGRPVTDLAQAIAPYLSGQRAVHRCVLEEVGDLEGVGYGVELALTRYIRRNRSRVTEVLLPDLTHLTKEEKLGFVKGFAARMRMYWEIVKVLPRD
jgi:glycosyltransferase involved in cell wall biosynthesis